MLVEKLKEEIDKNLTHEQFGVEELAKNMGMSRSQLHRKLVQATGQSVSQFIREYRLQLGMELLKKGELTASEVSDRIGFGSATYFSKCFNEYYGFPPGEVKTKMLENPHGVEALHPVGLVSSKNGSGKLLVKIAVVSLFALAAGTAIVFYFVNRNKVKLADKSIAILPFRNLSEGQGNGYFSEGVIEAIGTSLSQINDLRVISRTSVEQYRESKKSAHEIARELGVSTLLEGSVQRSENRIRIDVHLVDGVAGEQVWAKSYDREFKDVFSIQSEIAQQVANELNAQLSVEERSKLSKTDTDNPEAYDLFLKGTYEFNTYTNKGTHNAIRLLSRAVALDPGYARAYAALAFSHIGLATIFGAEVSARDAFKKGKPLIDKALELDPNLDLGHMLLGFYRLFNDWDFQGAEQEYKKAIVADYPDALAMYIDYLNFVSRHEEALAWSRRLDLKYPYYPNSRMVLSCIFTGRFKEADKFSESRLELYKNYYSLDSHGFLLLNEGRYAEAIVFFNKVIAVEGIRYPRMMGWMGAAYAKAGEREKAMEIIGEFKRRLEQKEQGSIAFFIAVIYSAMDEKAEALSWLNTAYVSHDMEMPWLMTEPQFNNLHENPEFKKLAHQVGLK